MNLHQLIAQKSAQHGRTMSQRIGAMAVAVLIAGGCAFVKTKFNPHGITQASAAESAWVHLSGEKPALSLAQTSFSGQPTETNSYGHPDGSRTDWVQSGSLALSEPNITVLIARQTQPKPIRYSVVRNLEDLSELKLVQHHYRPMYYAMDTRFGELRGVIFDVNADGVQKRCVGFHKPVSNKIFVKGFVCSRDQAEATPQKVACLIDRIHFSSAADDETVKASLADGEVRECGAVLLDPKSDAAADKSTKESL
jgi:hypothetical protein